MLKLLTRFRRTNEIDIAKIIILITAFAVRSDFLYSSLLILAFVLKKDIYRMRRPNYIDDKTMLKIKRRARKLRNMEYEIMCDKDMVTAGIDVFSLQPFTLHRDKYDLSSGVIIFAAPGAGKTVGPIDLLLKQYYETRSFKKIFVFAKKNKDGKRWADLCGADSQLFTSLNIDELGKYVNKDIFKAIFNNAVNTSGFDTKNPYWTHKPVDVLADYVYLTKTRTISQGLKDWGLELEDETSENKLAIFSCLYFVTDFGNKESEAYQKYCQGSTLDELMASDKEFIGLPTYDGITLSERFAINVLKGYLYYLSTINSRNYKTTDWLFLMDEAHNFINLDLKDPLSEALIILQEGRSNNMGLIGATQSLVLYNLEMKGCLNSFRFKIYSTLSGTDSRDVSEMLGKREIKRKSISHGQQGKTVTLSDDTIEYLPAHLVEEIPQGVWVIESRYGTTFIYIPIFSTVKILGGEK